MTAVIARDATATDHLVYAWPFPLGPEEIEISCGEDEIVVMCPSWLVGDRLGPGRHRWRTPDPTRPVGAFFVSTAPVETSFDVTTSFVIPATQQTATLRAQGSIIVRCVDPGLLIAQFVGLPFDNVNEGLLRSVTRSSERLIARVLTRRTVMAQTVAAVTDPGMLGSIVEELIAYNPAAGAVFGVEFVRMTGLYITTGELGWTTNQLHVSPDWSSPNVDAQGSAPRHIPTEPTKQGIGSSRIDGRTDAIVSGEIGRPETVPTAPIRQEDVTTPGIQPVESSPGLVPPPDAAVDAAVDNPDRPEKLRSTMTGVAAAPAPAPRRPGSNPAINSSASPTASGSTSGAPIKPIPTTVPPPIPRASAQSVTQPPPFGAAAAVSPPPLAPTPAVVVPAPLPPITPPAAASAAIGGTRRPTPVMTPSLASILPRPKTATAPLPPPPPPPPLAVVKPQTDAPGEPGGKVVAKLGGPTPSDGVPLPVMGIGMGGIGIGAGRVGDNAASITSEDEKAVTGEVVEKLGLGARVLVPGADGRLVSATIRQEQAGYYELEIGGSGETLWLPHANVVAEKA